MSVPSFTDLGKNARDVFRTGYHYGKRLIKLSVKSKSSDTVEVGSNLRFESETSKLTGTANTEYKMKDYGSLLLKWTTDGTVTLGYNRHHTIIPDIGLQSEISYNPETTARSVEIGAKCSKQSFNALCSISSDMNSNVNVLGSIVTAVKGLLIGYQGGYNSETNKMTTNDVGLAFNYRDVGFHFRCTSIPHEYGLSLLYRVNSDWDAAVDGILAKNGGIEGYYTLGAGARCNIDERSTFRCKFNTDLQLGMGLQQKLDENITLSLSFNIDCANVTRGGHKVGLAIEIEA
ncbi:Voltage-dependent anion-selective channel [Habropoda laboriosa]|uniref:Voltage-dependent anion-selective channel n=1 Tax=Habropoda laboriosa TaxID=597456 RepID=A0A0L7QNX5_9HYME|nr:Voltage-dependent anion-selective channel [Habropoda laboriosa]